MTKKCVFTGCSFTAGTGWSDQHPVHDAKDSPYLWTNLCARNIPRIQGLEHVNLAHGGASNTQIYRRTVAVMAELGSDIDTVFCQWTAMPRYNFNVGFELWDTSESLAVNTRSHDVCLNRGDRYSRKYIQDLMDRVRSLHHLHWEILQVVEFAHTIKLLAQKLEIPNVWFINGLCPWDEHYFLYLDGVLPEAYTEFTKKAILNIDSRDDKDILALYQLAHRHYQAAGGIDQTHWINLYSSFLHGRTDRNFDSIHPGIHSNQLYFQLIKEKIQ